jgi:ribosome-associated translation inhibitor RaiA
MKPFNREDMVQEATLEIEKFAPRNSHIEVDVKEDPVGHFSTNIKLQTKNRTFFAKKEDIYFYKSFSKALRALKNQLAKKRFNHVHQHVSLKTSNNAFYKV